MWVGVVMLAYAFVALAVEHFSGGSPPISVVPVSFLAWLLGVNGGLAAAALTVPISYVALAIAGGDVMVLLTPGSVFGFAALFFLAGVAGRIGELGRRLRYELEERQHVEMLLRERDTTMNYLMQTMPAMLLTTDRNLRITRAVGGGLAKLGVASPDLVGRALGTVLGCRSQNSYVAAATSALEGETVVDQVDLHGRVFDLRSGPLLGSEGEIVGTLGIAIDVTERAEAQRALESALEQERAVAERLRELDHLKNGFIEAVSHELRTPLTTVRGVAQTLKQSYARMREDQVVTLLERLDANGERLQRLLDDVLDLNRLSRGIVEPRRRPTDLHDLAKGVVDWYADERSLRLDSDGSLVADVDGPQIERIIENLVANALKYTPQDTDVVVRVAAVEQGAMLSVEQAGIGIPEELREAIFEPFQRGDRHVEHSPGTGIGLSLVRQFAELHGGRAWVDALDDGGAAFRVLLPTRARSDAVVAAA